MLGTALLLLLTVAVGGLAVYLVTYPPGVLDPASQEQPIIPPGIETETPTTAPPAGAPAPDPAAPVVQLTLGPACGAAAPLVEQADAVRDTSVDDPDALSTETITNLTRDLQTLSNIAPPELKTLIDTLNGVLVALNNSVIAGDDEPDLDGDAATAATDAIRTLCDPPE
jgi:hypothetical protein